MPRNFRNGVTKVVPIQGYANLKYVFSSRADPEDFAALGQTDLPANLTDATGYVIGCNAPKPGKAAKRKATGSESSFYDFNNRAALQAADWKCGRPKPGRSPSSSSLSDFVYININGVKYAWYCPRVPGEPGINATAAGLGVTRVDATDRVVYGCKFPRPDRAKIVIAGQGTYSTFIEKPTSPFPAGVEVVAGNYSAAGLLAFLDSDGGVAPE